MTPLNGRGGTGNLKISGTVFPFTIGKVFIKLKQMKQSKGKEEPMHKSSLRPSLLLGFILMNAFILGGCGKETFKAYLDPIKERLEQLEKKLTQLEGQSTEVKESVTKWESYTKALEEKIETLTKKIDEMTSKAASASAKTKTLPFVPQGTISQGEKRYHKVIQGETLYSIAKKYGLSVDKARRLNNLKKDQPIQPGQKLLVAPGRHQ